MKKKIILYSYYLICLYIAHSCTPPNPNNPLDNTPTSGKVRIGIDETLFPIGDAQQYIFENTYSRAKLNIAYKPEIQLIKDLAADTIQTIMLARNLNQKEKDFFEAKKIVPRITPIATDAIAIILNKKNNDSLLTYNQVINIIKNNITNWQQINPKRPPSEKINVVFDNQQSSTVNYMLQEAFMQTPASNSYALNNNQEVINYVQKNPNAIGIIGVTWISDSDDELTDNFLKQIKVARISKKNDPNPQKFYTPSQNDIAEKTYPFTRQLNIINCEGRAGLGTGFSAFVAGQIGQRIILKAGILPHQIPERLIQINNNLSKMVGNPKN